MRRGTEVLGKPVIAADVGQRLGRIEDVISDEHRQRVLGLRLKRRWLRRTRVLPYSDVLSVGPNAVVSRSAEAIVRLDEAEEIKRAARGCILRGKRLITADGRHLGSLVDIIFDDRTGAIQGYEVTTGRLLSKRVFVPAPETMTLGRDYAVIPGDTMTLVDTPGKDPTAELDLDSMEAPPH